MRWYAPGLTDGHAVLSSTPPRQRAHLHHAALGRHLVDFGAARERERGADQPVGGRAGIADLHIAARDLGALGRRTRPRLRDLDRADLVVGSPRAAGEQQQRRNEPRQCDHRFAGLVSRRERREDRHRHTRLPRRRRGDGTGNVSIRPALVHGTGRGFPIRSVPAHAQHAPERIGLRAAMALHAIALVFRDHRGCN